MKKLLGLSIFLLLSSLLLPIIQLVYASSPVTVTSDLTNVNTLGYSSQRKTFYASGRYWVFYIDNNGDIVWKSSLDSISWSSANIAVNEDNIILVFDVYGKGNVVALFFFENTDFDSFFQRGTLNYNGDISWSTSVLVYDGVDFNTELSSIDRDSNGWWWIASGVKNDARYWYKVWSSSNETGFIERYSKEGIDMDVFHCRYVVTQILPTTGNDVYFIIAEYNEAYLRYLKWDGENMGALTDHVLTNPMAEDVVKNNVISATIDDEDVMNIVWKTDVDEIYFVTFDGTDWGVETELESATAGYPSIGQNMINDNLDVYYFKNDTLYHRRYNVDEWLAADTPFEESFTNPTVITCSKYYEYGYIGVSWLEENTYSIMYGELESGGSEAELIDVDITNMEGCGNWLFAEERYYYFNASYGLAGGWENLGVCYIRWSDTIHSIEASYDVAEEIFTLENGADYVILKDGVVENVSNSILCIVFDFYLKKQIIDSYDIDIDLRVVSGLNDTGWQEIATDYFDIYNLGNIMEYAITGDGSRLVKGDVFEFEVDPATGSITANLTFRKLQHIKLLPKFSLPTNRIDSEYAGEWSAYYGIMYCYEKEDGSDIWVKGWNCKIEHSNGFQSPKDFWVKIHVRWYQGDEVLIGESEYFYSFWRPEPDIGTTLWVDLWFNTANASTVGGGRVSSEYFGMQDTTAWWQFWYSDWGPMLSNRTSSFYYKDLLGEDDEIISTQQIKLVKVWCKLEKTASSGSYEVALKDYTVFDKVFAPGGPQSVYYGIDTPDEIKPKVMDMPQNGFFGWLIQGLKNLLIGLTPPVLGLWDLFVNFMDNVFTFARWPNGFSQIVSWISSSLTWFITSITDLILLLAQVFIFINTTFTAGLTVLTVFITQFVAIWSRASDLLTGSAGSGIDILTSFNIIAFIQIFAILYPMLLLFMWEQKGGNAVMNHLNFVMNGFLWIFNILLGVANFVFSLVTGLIEAIPVAE